MSTKSDIWDKGRLRFYFDWHDQNLKLQIYDKLMCANEDYFFVLSKEDWQKFASAIGSGLKQYGKHIIETSNDTAEGMIKELFDTVTIDGTGGYRMTYEQFKRVCALASRTEAGE